MRRKATTPSRVCGVVRGPHRGYQPDSGSTAVPWLVLMFFVFGAGIPHQTLRNPLASSGPVDVIVLVPSKAAGCGCGCACTREKATCCEPEQAPAHFKPGGCQMAPATCPLKTSLLISSNFLKEQAQPHDVIQFPAFRLDILSGDSPGIGQLRPPPGTRPPIV